MKRVGISGVILLVGLILFFIFPFTSNFVSIINLVVFTFSIIFAISSLVKREGFKGWSMTLLIIGILVIFFILFNLILFGSPGRF